MRYTKYTKQNTTQKTNDWDTQSTLNKILHRQRIDTTQKTNDWDKQRLRYTKYTKQNTTQKTNDWVHKVNKILHRKQIEIHKVHSKTLHRKLKIEKHKVHTK